MGKRLFSLGHFKGYGQNAGRAKAFATLMAVFTAIWPAALWAEPLKVAVLGDSLVAGYGLPTEAGLVPQLEAKLQALGLDVALQNAGVSGDTTAGAAERLEWTLGEGASALVLLIGGNDMLRGMPLALTRSNIDAILSASPVPTYVIGVPASGNWGAAYQADFAEIYRSLAAARGAGLFEDYLAPLVEGRSLAEARRLYMQPDGIHPNAEGVAKIVERLAPELAAFLQPIE